MSTNKYNFDTTSVRKGAPGLKFGARKEVFGDAGVIPMWVADMDFECPPAVGEAIAARAAHNVYGYDFGGERVTPSVVGWLERRDGWAVSPEWLRFTTGVVAGLGFAIRAFTRPGDGVVIQTPVYSPFRTMTEVNDRKVVANPLRCTGDAFEIDFEDLEQKFAAGARAIILCNPHNPVARVFTESELRQLGELCVQYDVTIISDEIHSDLVFTPHKHLHIAALDPRFAERCVTFIAPSKTFNVAGLATSAAIITSEAMRRAWDEEYGRTHIIDGTLYGHIALQAAYDHGEDWLEELLPYLKANVDYVREFLATNIPQVRTFRHEGTYLMWLDFSQLRNPSEQDKSGFHKWLMSWLVKEAGLGLSSGADFGREGMGFARINVATSRATLEKAMGQLKKAIDKLIINH